LGLIAAIVGLAVLVMIHEAGHFFASRAVGMTPRKFYLGFGPAIAKTTRGKVEYGIGSIPLGGYVKIPGMNRPSPGDLTATLRAEDRERYRAELARLDYAIEREDWAAADAELQELRPALGTSRMWQELEWSLAPDAYWRQATWRRLTAIFAGPAVNLAFAFVLFATLFLVASEQSTTTIGRVLSGSPAAAAHVRAGDRILLVAGEPTKPDDIPKHIRATHGQPFTLVVRRQGKRVVLGPLRAKMDSGAYRIGIAIEARTGPGESLAAASRDALVLTWGITSDTVRGIGHLATGRDTNQAWRQGLRDFLFVLGLVSLALGLLNLLPVLPLDGGHIVMALVEKVRGKTFRQAVYIRYSVVGLTVFAVLMYFGLRNDLFGGGG
jgi:regulator of sigma E protease